MPQRTVPDHPDVHYYLVLFDEHGHERRDNGALVSDEISQKASDGVTDIFLLCHGWKGDIPAAIRQYDRWLSAMANQELDRQRIRETVPGFASLVVGVHWPSMPWGEEDAGAAWLGDEEVTDDFEAEAALKDAALVDRYAPRIADTAATRDALQNILTAAEDPAVVEGLASGQLPEDLVTDYRTLFQQAQLETQGALAPPGDDQAIFDPGRTVAEWSLAQQDGAPEVGASPAAAEAPGLLGVGDLAKKLQQVKNSLLMPVRQVSFWQMKRRARTVGESGVHELTDTLQTAAPHARLHLMGHSFGCIVATAAVAGRLEGGQPVSRLSRPVNSVLLVQGAMSLWSYADHVPFPPQAPGFYRALREAPSLINGPLVTTRSTFDKAVSTFYPLGAKVVGDVVLGENDGFPTFGAIGAFGIQGTSVNDVQILAATEEYGFLPGEVYNIEASRVICNGGGASGAHSDISHDEIAHVMWQSVAASALAAAG